MPCLSGLEVAVRLLESQPDARILVLSAYEDEGHILRSLEAGVAGYMLKDESMVIIVKAVQAVARGESWLSPRVAAKVTQRLRQEAPQARPDVSERERDILRLVAAGQTDQQIARQLHVAERTVRYHLQKLYARLGVSTRAEAAAWAARHGLGKK